MKNVIIVKKLNYVKHIITMQLKMVYITEDLLQEQCAVIVVGMKLVNCGNVEFQGGISLFLF